ncbi:hypothetical protein HJFPF1_06643 [Paramyrothecium foliicola]|nr:hypothetical protein HJFPF1_06643 [Paramyrothecium foliicola]
MVMTKGRRAKRILRSLSESQHHDHILAPSTIPLIRYNLLHNYHRCTQITIQLGDPHDLDFKLRFHHEAPRFLCSQFEAQKIADGSSLWAQTLPILRFIEANIRQSDQSRGFPTLFYCYSRENHRSYLFFAFFEMKMASQTYSASDLLRMRNHSAQRELYGRLQKNLRRDMDLSDIVRLPSDRSLPLIEEETKGLSEHFNDPCVSHHSLAPQLDGTGSEWRYRGRSDSEHDESQPIGAPSTLTAQKDEGFQRFYKAVVSPTHIRVTAGGRIVPNTRGSSSPTSKWAKEKSNIEPVHPQSVREPPAYSPIPISQPTFGTFPPMFPGFMPAMQPSVAAGPHAFPMMPWPVGFGVGSPFGMAPFSPMHAVQSNTSLKRSPESIKSDNTGDEKPADIFKQRPLAPPEHFDPARPFLYNGQWMMHPVGHAISFGLPPYCGLQASHSLGNPSMMPQTLAGSPVNQGAAMRDLHSNSSQSQYVQSASVVTSPGFPPPYKPLISSIRPSEITKKQIDVLRGSLKYVEDQLQYNKHQIDEKAMESQAQMVRQQIQQFEKNLATQLGFEKAHYPVHEEKGGSCSSESSSDHAHKNPCGVEAKTVQPTGDASSASQDDYTHGRIFRDRSHRQKPASRFASGINSTKSVSAFQIQRVPDEAPDSSEPSKRRTTLPVTAALAPPFQPHSASINITLTEEEPYNGHGLSLCGPDWRSDQPNEGADTSVVPSATCLSDNLERKSYATPYLVGQVPSGMNARSARNVDYSYSRELTEDELRARHMYWGMAPTHLQRGLPKFDGKDFYPPSPVKEVAAMNLSSPTSSDYQLSTEGIQRSSAVPGSKPQMGAVQWFRPVPRTKRHGVENGTQSESIPRQEQSDASLTASDFQRPGSCTMPPEHTRNRFRAAIKSSAGGSASTDSKGRTSSDDCDDDKVLLFKGRKSMSRVRTKTHNEIWQSVLKKGKSSANAAPGAVSSTTVQGVLPHYAGHATASLTPTIANTSSRTIRNKGGEINNEDTTHPTMDKRGENLPPGDHNVALNSRRDGYPAGNRKGMVSR